MFNSIGQRRLAGIVGLIAAIACAASIAIDLSIGNYGMAFVFAFLLYLNIDNFIRNYWNNRGK